MDRMTTPSQWAMERAAGVMWRGADHATHQAEIARALDAARNDGLNEGFRSASQLCASNPGADGEELALAIMGLMDKEPSR